MVIDGVTVDETENGIALKIDAWKIWQELTEEQKYLTVHDEAHHDMFERNVKFGLAKSTASEHFNLELHELRQMILTDDELVDEMFVSLTKEFARIAEAAKKNNVDLSMRNQQLANELDKRGIRIPDPIRSNAK